jgi:hypothetical protein
MSILIDFSNVYVAGIHAMGNEFKQGESKEKMAQVARHLFLNSLLGYKKAWAEKCGNIVICCDGKKNWRKDAFAYYKAARKAGRDASDLDWASIFDIMNDIKMELAKLFPYKVVQADRAEGDDVIFVLAKYFQDNELIVQGLEETPQHIMTISADHDFLQLYKYRNYAQWSPRTKKVISRPESSFLVEKIIRGDAGDGVPSVLCHDDFFVEKDKYGRAVPITKKVITHYSDLKNLNEVELSRYRRNEQLISAEFIPDEVAKNITDIYKMAPDKINRAGIFEYCIKHNLHQLAKRQAEF